MFTKETYTQAELEKHIDYAADYVIEFNASSPMVSEFKGKLILAIVDLADRIISDENYAIVDEATMSYLSLKYKVAADNFTDIKSSTRTFCESTVSDTIIVIIGK